MKKIIIIIITILLIPFFIITIKDIDRTPTYPTETLTLTETTNSNIALNNHTLEEVFEDTSLIEDLQLVTNGDFSAGTTGWVIDINTVVDNELVSSATSGFLTYQLINALSSNKFHLSFYVRKLGTGGLRIEFRSDTTTVSNQLIFGDSITTSMLFQSGILTLTSDGDRLAITRVVGDNNVISDNYRLFNISTLITNKQYSPLYETTFDLMNDIEIKAQMDEFVSKPYLFIDYETLGFELSTAQMDYWYNVYLTYSPSYDYIQFGTSIAGTYALFEQLIIDNQGEDFKVYRDDIIDNLHYTLTQNIDNIQILDENGQELLILYSDDTYISRTSLTDTTTFTIEGYHITSYTDGDFNNTVLAFFWIIPILLIGGLIYIIISKRKEE